MFLFQTRTSGGRGGLLLLLSLLLMCLVPWGESAFLSNKSQPPHRFHSSVRITSSSTKHSSSSSTSIHDNNNDDDHHTKDDLASRQRQKLMERGRLEQVLMSPQQSPLEWHRPPPVVEENDHDDNNPPNDTTPPPPNFVREAQHYATLLEQTGVVRIDNVLNPCQAQQLKTCLLQYKEDSIQLVKEDEEQQHPQSVAFQDRFARVLVDSHRWDLKVPLLFAGSHDNNNYPETIPQIVQKSLEELFMKSPVGQVFEQVLGIQSTLYECACLISERKSPRQNIHPDHPCSTTSSNQSFPKVLTCFVALQDIDDTMGPTTWIPRTHNSPSHERFQRTRIEDILDTQSPKDTLLQSMPNVVGLLPIGSCVIFDSRVLHCGGANVASSTLEEQQRTRALFYISMKHPQVDYPGNVGSIGYGLDDLKFTLGELKEILSSSHNTTTS